MKININHAGWSINRRSVPAVPDFNVSQRLDYGIAMMHIGVTAQNDGKTGKWMFMDSPNVTRFTVD